MALATRCPHCGTSFRVAQDQLKLRAGLVRCGACKEIFNGAENLFSLEGIQSVPGAASPATPALPANTAVPASDTASANTTETGDGPAFVLPPSATPADTASAPAGNGVASVEAPAPPRQEEAATADAVGADATRADIAGGPGIASRDAIGYHDPDTRPDPLTRMTLMDFAGTGLVTPSNEGASDGDTHDEVGQAIDEMKRKPWRRRSRRRNAEIDAIDAIDEAGMEPEFLRRARRQEHFARRFGAAMAIGSGVLAITLLLQGAYAFRNQLAAMAPQSRPALLALCKLASCRIELPAQIDAVSIETNELQAIAENPDGLLLTALLRNRSTLPQTWPSIELTLSDSYDKPLARRVFGPRDYLGADSSNGKGFPANSEQGVKLQLALDQLKPAGYRLYLFYP
jgi:predicted Zn finger-like uncharacterized protein